MSAAPARPLRLAVIGHALSPHVRFRTQLFSRLGHEVFLLTHEFPETTLEGVQVVDVSPSGREFVRLVAIWNRYRRALRRIRPDATIVHFAQDLGSWSAAYAGPWPVAAVVMGGDVLFDEQGTPSPTARWATVELLRAAAVLAVKSDYLMTALERLGDFRAKSLRTLWCGDTARFRPRDPGPIRRRLGIAEDAFVILSPKSLTPFYNIDRIVEAAARVAGHVPHVHLLVCTQFADDGYRRALERQVGDLGLEGRVTFLPPLDNAEMPDIYAAADVAVAVPPSDGIPMTLLEAMACGTPNVLSDLPNLREIVRPDVNALCVPIDSDAIAEAMLRLYTDDVLRIAVVEAGAATVAALPTGLDDARAIEQSLRRAIAAGPAHVPKTRRRLMRQAIFNWHLEHSFGGYRYTSRPPASVGDFEKFQPLWHLDLALRFVRKSPRRWFNRLIAWPLGDLWRLVARNDGHTS